MRQEGPCDESPVWSEWWSLQEPTKLPEGGLRHHVGGRLSLCPLLDSDLSAQSVGLSTCRRGSVVSEALKPSGPAPRAAQSPAACLVCGCWSRSVCLTFHLFISMYWVLETFLRVIVQLTALLSAMFSSQPSSFKTVISTDTGFSSSSCRHNSSCCSVRGGAGGTVAPRTLAPTTWLLPAP